MNDWLGSPLDPDAFIPHLRTKTLTMDDFMKTGPISISCMTELGAAIDLLQQSAETCEHNATIHESEGNQDQAKLCRELAKSYRAAEQHLKAVND